MVMTKNFKPSNPKTKKEEGRQTVEQISRQTIDSNLSDTKLTSQKLNLPVSYSGSKSRKDIEQEMMNELSIISDDISQHSGFKGGLNRSFVPHNDKDLEKVNKQINLFKEQNGDLMEGAFALERKPKPFHDFNQVHDQDAEFIQHGKAKKRPALKNDINDDFQIQPQATPKFLLEEGRKFHFWNEDSFDSSSEQQQ